MPVQAPPPQIAAVGFFFPGVDANAAGDAEDF
jgi:hypothetical protein